MLIAAILVSAVLSSQAQAILSPGVRIGTYEGDFFVGADLKFGLAMFHANPNIEYIFVDNATFFTASFDGFMNFLPLPVIHPYAGGGVGLVYVKPDDFDSKTDFALNLILGVDVSLPLNPYAQFKYVVTDDNAWVFAIGIRF